MKPETTEIWTHLHDSLLSFIKRRVPSPGEAEDILQDVFVRVHTSIDGLRDTDRLRSWVYQIARNAITDYYRAKAREPAQYAEPVESTGDGVTAEQELASCIQPLLGALPDEYREAIVLTEIDGLTQKAAAQRAGLSLSGMKSRVQRGRARMRQSLLECCHVELDRRGGIVDYEARDCTVCPPFNRRDDRYIGSGIVS